VLTGDGIKSIQPRYFNVTDR